MISKCPALSLSGRQVVVRGAAPDWPSGQAARCRMAATQWQPCGPGLFAPIPASSFSRGRTSTPSLFLGLRANSSRRGVLGDHEQALKAIIMFVLAGLLWIVLLGWLIHLWSILDAALYKPGR